MGDTKIMPKGSEGVTARITSINGVPVNIKAQEIALPLVPPKRGEKNVPTFYYMDKKTSPTPSIKEHDVDIDGDGIADIFHLDTGTIFLKNQCPAAKQLTKPLNERPDVVINTQSVDISIEDLKNKVYQ